VVVAPAVVVVATVVVLDPPAAVVVVADEFEVEPPQAPRTRVTTRKRRLTPFWLKAEG
jgi:hypothetical protein